MSRLRPLMTSSLAAVDRGVDRLKFGYKRRFDRWKGLRIASYFGYATPETLYLSGRVLDDESHHPPEKPTMWTNVWNTLQRIDSDEVPGACVRLDLDDTSATAECDEEGFFHFELPTPDSLVPGRRWTAELTLLDPPGHEDVTSEASGLYPSADCRFAVISDLDDTVVRTGARSRLRMARTVLFNNAQTRVPMPGIAALYRALEAGRDGQADNPVFYVSSSPWNLYSLFAEFMRHHDVPEGPIFLRDFGFDPGKLWKEGHEEHKPALIRRLLEVHPDLDFVLMGDSGQKDPEVFRRVAEENPERIAAIVVRDVTPDARDREVDEIARELEAIDVPMARVETSAAAAERCAELGLISREAVDEVAATEERDRTRRDEPKGLKRWLLGHSS
jgi:phosphatidate phosphatase APP1